MLISAYEGKTFAACPHVQPGVQAGDGRLYFLDVPQGVLDNETGEVLFIHGVAACRGCADEHGNDCRSVPVGGTCVFGGKVCPN